MGKNKVKLFVKIGPRGVISIPRYGISFRARRDKDGKTRVDFLEIPPDLRVNWSGRKAKE